MQIGRIQTYNRNNFDRIARIRPDELNKANAQEENARRQKVEQEAAAEQKGFKLISPFKEGNVLQGMADTIKKFSAMQEQKENSTPNFFTEDEETTGQMFSCYG